MDSGNRGGVSGRCHVYREPFDPVGHALEEYPAGTLAPFALGRSQFRFRSGSKDDHRGSAGTLDHGISTRMENATTKSQGPISVMDAINGRPQSFARTACGQAFAEGNRPHAWTGLRIRRSRRRQSLRRCNRIRAICRVRPIVAGNPLQIEFCNRPI